MSVFNDIVDKIKDTLINTDELSSIKFVNTYPFKPIQNPLIDTYVSMGICNIKIKDGSFSSYLGTENQKDLYGHLSNTDIEFKIYSPKNKGGKSCYDIFASIYEALLLNLETIKIESVICGKVNYDPDTFSFTLDFQISFKSFIGYSVDGINISEIVVINNN